MGEVAVANLGLEYIELSKANSFKVTILKRSFVYILRSHEINDKYRK